MTEYTYRIDLPTEPPAVAVEDRTVTLSRNVVQFDNTGLWGAEQLTFQDEEGHDPACYSERFEECWGVLMADIVDESMRQDGDADPDALATDLYEQLLAVQESQAATDAALSDIYEALAGGE